MLMNNLNLDLCFTQRSKIFMFAGASSLIDCFYFSFFAGVEIVRARES